MVYSRYLAGIVLAATVAVAGAAGIDLTPTAREILANGFKYTKLEFKDDKRLVLIDLPNGWTYSGAGDQLRLQPPSPAKFADGSIQAVALKAPQELDDAVAKAFKEQVLRGVPPTSQGVTVVAENDNSIVFCGYPNREVVVSYKVLGQTFHRSAILVAYADRQLIFTFTAPQTTFTALNEHFRRTINSWHWVEPRPTAGSATAEAPQSTSGPHGGA